MKQGIIFLLIRLAVTAIDNKGMVIAVSKPTQVYLQGILPSVGNSIYMIRYDKCPIKKTDRTWFCGGRTH